MYGIVTMFFLFIFIFYFYARIKPGLLVHLILALYASAFLMRNVAHVQIQEVYGEAGVRGFWKGVLPTLIMVCDKWLLMVLMEGH